MNFFSKFTAFVLLILLAACAGEPHKIIHDSIEERIARVLAVAERTDNFDARNDPLGLSKDTERSSAVLEVRQPLKDFAFAAAERGDSERGALLEAPAR